jgi:hypothetical protein
MRFVMQALPDATVEAKQAHSSTVSIKSGTGVVVWSGPQRDLYRKYGWPAQKEIVSRMQMYKEDVLGMDD